MGKRIEEIDDAMRAFLERQHVFFVATAPLSESGHVNLSPKGLDTFRVLGPNQVAYLDLTGSGNETASHVAENGRMTLMFCAFSGRPEIVRLYCRGRSVLPDSDEWELLSGLFPEFTGTRQIIVGDVEFLLSSCGYAVPEMAFVKDRNTLTKWAEKKGEEGLVTYRRTKNRKSLDGIAAPFADE